MTDSPSLRQGRVETAALLLRAAARMTPRMVYHRLRRVVRKTVARRFPAAFDRYVQDAAQDVPGLGRGATGPAAFVARFYVFHHEAHRDDLANGIVSLFGRSRDFGGPDKIDWRVTLPEEGDHQLWRMKLNHMGFVCALLLSPEPRHTDAALRMVRSFPRAPADWAIGAVFESTWFPYSVSHRVLALTSALVLARDGIGERGFEEIEAFLRFNVGFLAHNIEHDTRNNHVERNLAALCFYYSHADSVPDRIARMLDREVRGIVVATVLADGVQVERSAMYQGLTVMALQIFAASPFLAEETRRLASTRAERAAQAWTTLSHPDGEIALFNDSWFGETPPARDVVATSAADSRTILADGGYARLGQDDDVLILDAGPIGPAWNPGHGHADFLAVELSMAGKRFLVDPGTSLYSSGAERQRERSHRAHNGPGYEDIEPVEFQGAFKVGRLAAATLISGSDMARLPASAIGGFLDMKDAGRVARCVAMVPGKGFLISDHWRANAHAPRLRFLIPKSWTLARADERTVTADSGADRLTFHVASGTIAAIEDAQWCRHYMKPEPATAIAIRPENAGDGAAAAIWVGRERDGPAELVSQLAQAVRRAVFAA